MPAVETGLPREDRFTAWSFGLGRTVSRRAFLRGGYRRERRDSNIAFLDNRTGGLIVQLGVDLSWGREDRR